MKSEIKSFYSNTNVLITGATGLFGKMLIYKLLDTCDDINGIYLIVRAKKEKNIEERLEEIFKADIFKKLKEKNREFDKKVHIISGDCTQFGLGINPTHRNLLIDKVNIVFHCAALLNMDGKMKDAVDTNIRGLNELLDLCHEIHYLKSMVFVSTAYSNCNLNVIEEKFYKTPIQASTLIKFTEEIEEDILISITPRILNKWPNTYCYTKAVAENLLSSKAENLPVGLFRPSIVMPTYSDPFPGWISNIYGPLAAILTGCLGILRVTLCDPKSNFDFVPVDYCVNALICAAQDIHNNRNNSKKTTKEDKIPVYNYSGGLKRNITWEEFVKYTEGFQYPFKNCIWITAVILTNNRFYYNCLWYLLHIIPGYLTDGLFLITGQKARLIKMYGKLAKRIEVLAFFTTKEWDIRNKNICSLWDRLNKTDQELFPFNMDVMDYKKYVQDVLLGVKLYILRENLDNVVAERNRYRRLNLMHKSVKWIFHLLLFLATYAVIKYIILCFGNL